MFLGFSSRTPLWKEYLKEELVERLVEETQIPLDRRGYKKPFIETDIEGVYIRNVEHLSEGDRNGLIHICGDVYSEVMDDDMEVV